MTDLEKKKTGAGFFGGASIGNRVCLLFGCAVCALLGASILSVSMARGVGIGGDAVIYLESARNFAAGRGVGLIQPDDSFRLIPYFPPLYPIVLAIFSAFGANLTDAAIWINLICFALTVGLLSYAAGRTAGRWYIGTLTGLFLASSPILIPGYSWAMSEPLANALGLAALWLLIRSIQNESGWVETFFSIVCAGLAGLTRYSMVIVPAVGFFMILILSRAPVRRRIGAALIYLIGSMAPVTGWMVYDRAQTATMASRSFVERSGLIAEIGRYLGQADAVLQGWLLPESWIAATGRFGSLLTLLSFALTAIVLIVFFAALTVRLTRAETKPDLRLSLLLTLATFCSGYAALIGAVSVLTYPPITIGQRMFLPAYLATVLLIALLFGADWIESERRGKVRFALMTILALTVTAFFGLRGVRIARQNAIAGFAFDAPSWRESDTIAVLKTMVDNRTVLISNEETALRLYLEKPVWQLKEIYAEAEDPLPKPYRDLDAAETDPARTAILNDGGLLVLFDSFEDQLVDIYGSGGRRLAAQLTDGLELLYDGDDGRIYRYCADEDD